MGAEENLAAARRGYAAFIAGDAAAAMAEMVDDVEWITPGNSAVSGTVRGKQALGELWAALRGEGLRRPPAVLVCRRGSRRRARGAQLLGGAGL
jgi:ketosteroid isomerase-like protein